MVMVGGQCMASIMASINGCTMLSAWIARPMIPTPIRCVLVGQRSSGWLLLSGGCVVPKSTTYYTAAHTAASLARTALTRGCARRSSSLASSLAGAGRESVI